jgi:uncharacterized protein (TIGR00725 family)
MMERLYLDRGVGRLYGDGVGAFDPAARRWLPATGLSGEPIEPHRAVVWLQRESGAPCRVPIGVIGPREASAAERDAAFAIGAGLAGLGLTLLCGGKGGVMEAACAGAASAGGLSVGLLPDDDWGAANPYVAIPIATGIGVARNAIIARAALALVAIGGGYGTLSEIAFGLQFDRPVLTLLDAPAAAGTRPCASPEAALAVLCRIVLALPA